MTVAARLKALFPLPVGVGLADPRVARDAVFHVEQSAVETATPARQREFLAGRVAARQAQTALGLTPRPVPLAADRSPMWPPGLCGSISHTGTACAAVVAHAREVRSLGLDVEDAEALPADIWETVLHHDEQAWINQQENPPLTARVFFSAKECAYKAQYPLSGALFGFDTIAITLDPDEGGFAARFLRDVSPFCAGDTLEGRYSIGDGLILTGIAIRR